MSRQCSFAQRWHADRRDWSSAINYAIRAQRWPVAAAWLAESGEEIVERRGETSIYLSFCERMPVDALADPSVIFWMIWASFFSSDYDRASTLLRKHIHVVRACPELASNAPTLSAPAVDLFAHCSTPCGSR